MKDCAASVLVTVVSTARPGQIIVDGGSKTFSSDRASSSEVTFGHIVEAPEASFHKMNEEHGYVDVTKVNRDFAIGELVTCPFCLAAWVATGLTGGLVLAPRLTRLVATALTATAASDFLQMAYSIAKEKAE